MGKLLTFIVFSMLLPPAIATDVSGVWNLQMRWPGDRQATGICTFKQDGQKLTGSCGDPDKFPITGEIQDNRLTWEFDVEQDGTKGRMVFSGVLDSEGMKIEGSCRIVGANDGTFTMKKR
jgi:hypothetical protein